MYISRLDKALSRAYEMEILADRAENEKNGRAALLRRMAWRQYKTLLPAVRRRAERRNTEAAWTELATLLSSMARSPMQDADDPAEYYWQSQYVWLSLHFSTGRPRYLEEAKFAESLRHREPPPVCAEIDFELPF